MSLLKGQKSIYYILLTISTGCGFFAGIFIVKVFKHLRTVSLTEIAIAFLSSVLCIICMLLSEDVNNRIKNNR